MVDPMTDHKIGTGGRLYRDARQKAGQNGTPTPPPAVGYQAPPIPQPWMVSPVEPQTDTAPKPDTAKPPRDWQQILATLLELLGMALLTAGVTLIYIPAGFVVAGICAVIIGVALGLPTDIQLPHPRKKSPGNSR